MLNNDEIPCLPPSETGESVISCSHFVRANFRQLQLFGAEKKGVLPADTARKLSEFVGYARPLLASERKFVQEALATILSISDGATEPDIVSAAVDEQHDGNEGSAT